MTRSVTYKEAYRLFRNEGVDVVASAFVAFIWVVADVQIEI